MWQLHQMLLAEQHQRELHKQAEKWRIAHPKETYQPNKAIRNIKRKR